MEEKKYLKWYNKIGYGSGDVAGNVVYAFLTSFMMVYLTDSVGLAAGVVGTLIAVSNFVIPFQILFFFHRISLLIISLYAYVFI